MLKTLYGVVDMKVGVPCDAKDYRASIQRAIS